MDEYRIGLARAEQIGQLAAIERAAAALFPDELISDKARAETVSRKLLQEALDQQRLWVAERINGEAVGFALAAPERDSAFLVEIDVHPGHQRRGLGRLLIQAVLDWARVRDFARVGLTTFADPPWNAPFYERLGFRRLSPEELTLELASRLAEEKAQGLKRRVAMELTL